MPTVQFAKCPGCSGPVLVVKMENCPICNEPTKKLNLRTDHVSSGMGVSAMCKGVASRGEIGVIELERQHASQTEQQLSGSVKKEVA